MGMVIVVPAFAVTGQCHPPEVSRSICGFVIPITPDVSCRVHEPGTVVTEDCPHTDTPQSQRPAEAGFHCFAGDEKTNPKQNCEDWKNSVEYSMPGVFPHIRSPASKQRFFFRFQNSRLEPQDV